MLAVGNKKAAALMARKSLRVKRQDVDALESVDRETKAAMDWNVQSIKTRVCKTFMVRVLWRRAAC
jgi:hypothetical protein